MRSWGVGEGGGKSEGVMPCCNRCEQTVINFLRTTRF